MFNATEAIKAVYPHVKGFKGIIAGGVVADHYFKKPAKDVDVFAVPSVELENFVTKYNFEEYHRTIGQEIVHEYHGMSRGDIIEKVYQGELEGFPVDVVVLTTDDVKAYIKDSFDLSTKLCWYDGEFTYTNRFTESVAKNLVSMNRYEPTGYIRAHLNAEKYGMELGEEYELSKHYVSYLKEEDLLEEKISKKYHDLITSQMYVPNVDLGKVISADLVMLAEPTLDDVKMLAKLNEKDIVCHHPITKERFTVETKNMKELYKFKRESSNIAAKVMSKAMELSGKEVITQEEASKITEEYFVLHSVEEHDFMEGKLTVGKRKLRMNKYISGLTRKYGKLLEIDLSLLSKMVENRMTSQFIDIEFSGNRLDLLTISTGRAWRSCQKWELGTGSPHASGLLGNISGATAVGISKDASGNWNCRFLVRIGENNALFLENIYTNKVEYGSALPEIKATLEARGYTVHISGDREFSFKGLNTVFTPYNDNNYSLRISRNKTKGMRFLSHKKKTLCVPQQQQPIPFAIVDEIMDAPVRGVLGQEPEEAVLAVPQVEAVRVPVNLEGPGWNLGQGDDLFAVPRVIRRERVLDEQGDEFSNDPFAVAVVNPTIAMLHDEEDLPF